MGFGISILDDGSVRRVLQVVAPIQQRNYVVMEVKSNLVKDERTELFRNWPSASFRRTASVMMGEPPSDLKKRCQALSLKQKQEVADVDFRARQVEEKRQRDLELQKK